MLALRENLLSTCMQDCGLHVQTDQNMQASDLGNKPRKILRKPNIVWNVYQLSFLKFDVIVSKQFCPFNDFFNVTQYKEVIVKKKSLLVRHGGMQIWIWFFKRIHFWNNWSIDGIYAGYTWPGVTVKSYFCSKLNVMKNKPNNTILCYYSYHLKSHPRYSPCEYRYIYVCIFFSQWDCASAIVLL